MKMKRGRPTKITGELVRRICGLLAKGSSISSACVQVGLSPASYFNWQQRAKQNEEPFARFFFRVTRTREAYKQKLIEIVMRAVHEDARHAQWLLERCFANEFSPCERRTIPFDPTAQPVPDLSNSLPLVLRLRDGREMDIHEAAKLVALQRETSPPAPPPPPYNPVTKQPEPPDSDDGNGAEQ
jgi:hypothetical protein